MNLHNVIRGPMITEKSEFLREAVKDHNRYTLKVAPEANKELIKQALHKIYNVKVASVNIINVPGKKKRFKMGVIKTPSWKKAIVTLVPGQKIEFSK